jgi:hypothetical protein
MGPDGLQTNGARPRKRIFLSYGHDEHASDARRIKTDIEARGHEVWFDEERLREGRDWEAWIEQGLRQCDLVVLLMTPHSVRRRNPQDPQSRDGYCLNEIAAALLRNKLIIPVMLVSLEPDGPPTSLCRIQYLDLRDAIPVDGREAVYRVRLDRLFRAIELDDLDFEGGQARLIRWLQPLRFEQDIGKHIAQFSGRTWLFNEIDQWLYQRPESRVFWLTGKPGVGKTAIAARLCHTRREIIAYHLCTATDDDRRNPVRAVTSIAYQMSQHLPEYERALHSIDLEAMAAKNAQTVFNDLVLRPLRMAAPQPDGPRIVVVDAIDEATSYGRNAIAAFVADCWEDTPRWLRLIITSRPEEAEIVARLSHLRPYELDAQSDENAKDLRAYVVRELVARSLTADARTIDEIINRSEGLFLYAKVVIDEIDNHQLSIDRVDQFPRGLGGHYQRFFERQFPNLDRYRKTIAPMLQAICAQREALPIPVLRRALGARVNLLTRLTTLGSLFPRAPQHGTLDAQSVSPFHKSIRDWLTTGVGPYQIDLAAGESLLAKTAMAWEQFAEGPAQRYLLRHGVPHLVNTGEFVKASALLYRLLGRTHSTDPIMLEHFHEAGRYLCAWLVRCPPSETKRLRAEELVDIAVECCDIDHYTMVPAFRLLYYASHRSAWPAIRRRILRSNSWSAMYALSLVLAEAHSSHGSDKVLQEIADLTAATDMDEQELGLYAFKLLEGPPASLMDTARRLASSDAFIVRALLYEFLLSQALIGEDVCAFIQSTGLWSTPWPYHRTQLNDIAAVQEVVRRSPTPFSAEPGVQGACGEIAATLRSRDELIASPAITAEPALRDLLRNYERLPRRLHDLPRATQEIRRSGDIDRVLLALFAHPAWEVRAGISSVAASIAGGRPEIAQRIAGWIEHPNYRVRYSAIEAAYRMRHQDDAALFETAVRRHAGDEQAWIRGIVADCLSEWITRDGTRWPTERLARFAPEMTRLLHDTDMWPLEAMAFLARRLREEGVGLLTILATPIGGLLGRVPGWEKLERPALQTALNTIVWTERHEPSA